MDDERYTQLMVLCDEGVEAACDDLWLEFDLEVYPNENS
jgi:hypothetical protein